MDCCCKSFCDKNCNWNIFLIFCLIDFIHIGACAVDIVHEKGLEEAGEALGLVRNLGWWTSISTLLEEGQADELQLLCLPVEEGAVHLLTCPHDGPLTCPHIQDDKSIPGGRVGENTSAPASVSRFASHWKLVRLPEGQAPTTPYQDSPATPAPSAKVLLRPPRPLHGRTGKLNEEEDETSHLFWRRSDQVLVVLVPCHSLWINSLWPSKTLFFNGKQCILMISGSNIIIFMPNFANKTLENCCLNHTYFGSVEQISWVLFDVLSTFTYIVCMDVHKK